MASQTTNPTQTREASSNPLNLPNRSLPQLPVPEPAIVRPRDTVHATAGPERRESTIPTATSDTNCNPPHSAGGAPIQRAYSVDSKYDSPTEMQRPEVGPNEQRAGVGAHGLGKTYPLSFDFDSNPYTAANNAGNNRCSATDPVITYAGSRGDVGAGGGGGAGDHGISVLVPTIQEKKPHRLTVDERLSPTIKLATDEKDKYVLKAKMTGYALNAAIGAQVVLGALTTGLSAVTTGRQTSIVTAFLGGLSTIAASYLARARGGNEPELSISRTKDLEQFIRECVAYRLDYGHLYGVAHDGADTGIPPALLESERQVDRKIDEFRRRFEDLLGNASGERKLAPPV